MQSVLVGIVGFIIGAIVGFLVREHFGKKIDAMNASSLILLVVAMCWGLSVLFDIVSSSYETPIAVHGLMGMIVGFFYKK